MRAWLLAALLVATPLAAAATFVDPPPTRIEMAPCGEALCVALDPAEQAVRVHRGTYAFHAGDGTLLAAGAAGVAHIPVPPGAVLLVVRL